MNQSLNNKIEKSYPLVGITGSDTRKILHFQIDNQEVLPGQFFMLNYKCSQKPFSVASCIGNKIEFTIEDRGECSNAMINARVGEYFGLTGPLGKTFNTVFDKYLLVGGGIGIAPIMFLAQYLINSNKKVDMLIGERTKKNIIYQKELNDLKKNNNFNIEIYTDDGSFGKQGFVTKDIENYISKNKYESICICGPERMMTAIIKLAEGKTQSLQVCMERYMKCGIGICGSCVMDDIGLRVCVEGPVFEYAELKSCKEFGLYHRDSHGIIEKF